MSGKQARQLRRTVAKALAARGLSADELWREHVKPRPRWCPPFFWAWALAFVLKPPAPAVDVRANLSFRALLRAARAKLARRGLLRPRPPIA